MNKSEYAKEHEKRYEETIRQRNAINNSNMRDKDIDRPEEILKQRNILRSFGVQDKGIEKYRKETTKIQEKDKAERDKDYAELRGVNIKRLEAEAILAEKTNKEILEKKQKRQNQILEKKESEKREQIAEIIEAEEMTLEKKEETEEKTKILLDKQYRKQEKAKRVAVKLGASDKIRRDKKYTADQIRKKKSSGTKFELREQNRRKLVDKGILSKRDYAVKYHEEGG